MAGITFTKEQLNYFKFSSMVIDEYAAALRDTFKSMWDSKYGTVQPWDDSLLVRTTFKKQEKAKRVFPSIQEWDCKNLFDATIYSQSFSVPQPGGKAKTRSQMYIDPKRMPRGSLHANVTGASQDETNALSIDQLRRLRNKACHSSSTKEIDKPSFDNYVQLTKDAFTALGQSTAVIDNIGALTEDDFPTGRVRALEDAILTYLVNENVDGIQDIQESSKTILREVRETAKKSMETAKESKEEILENVRSVGESVIKRLDTITTESQPSLPCCESLLPPKVPHFTGRQKEIDDVIDHLKCQSPTRLVTIWGSGGFGKTSLATVIGYELDSRGTVVFFVSLKSINTVDDVISKLLALFGQYSSESFAHCGAVEELSNRLHNLTQPCTLILDNVDDLLSAGGKTKSVFLQNVVRLVQSNAKLKIICTTREVMSYAGCKLDTYSLQIGALESADSMMLLRNLVNDIAKKECEKLVEICLHVPLAIELVSSIICVDNVKPGELLSELSCSENNILEVMDQSDNPDDLRLGKIIEYSFSKLSSKHQQMFLSLSVFPSSFDGKAAAAVLNERSVVTLKKEIGILMRKSLVEFNAVTERYSLHDFMKAFADLKEVEDQKSKLHINEARHRLLCYYLSMIEKLNADFLTGMSQSSLHSFEKDRENIIHCLNEAISCGDELYERAVNILTDLDIFLDCIYWSDQRGHDKLYDTYITASKERNQPLAASNLLVSKAFGSLHWDYDKETCKMLSEADDLQQSIPSVPPAVRGRCLCYRGFREIFLTHMKEGLKLLEMGIPMLDCRSLNIVIKTLGLRVAADCHEIQNDTARATMYLETARSSCSNECLESLVLLLSDTTNGSSNVECRPLNTELLYFLANISTRIGNKEKVVVALQSLSGLSRSASECENIETADSYFQTGQSFRKLGDYASGLDAHNRALEIRQKLLGEQEKTANSYLHVGYTYSDLGDYTSALNAHKRALGIRLKLLAECESSSIRCENVARSYENVGDAYNFLEDHSNAIDSYKDALTMTERVVGAEHESTALLLDALGSTYSKLNDHTNALDAHRRELDIRLKLLAECESSSTRENVATSYVKVGNTYNLIGDHSNAIDSYKEALTMTERVVGAEHERTACLLHALGSMYSKLNDHINALDAHKRALEINRKTLKEHELTALSFDFIGFVYSNMEDWARALDAFENSFVMRRKVLGDHEATATSLYQMANIHVSLKNYATALDTHTRALEMRQELLGQHESVAWSFDQIGVVYSQMADHVSALAAHKSAFIMRLKLFGNDHKDTARSRMYVENIALFLTLRRLHLD